MAGDGEPQDASRNLDAYRRKRHAGSTPEPFAGGPAGAADGPVFVVQRHSARRLHYDLRLERDGVLASWAVPKGLPTTAGGRRLAVHTEDHPLAYAGFEGVIPAGQYGAGTMDVYDRGVWEPVEERKDGGLTFRLRGTRLQGTWTLVPARLDGQERNWLLLRRADDGPAGPRATPRYEPMLATLSTEVPAGDDWLHELKWDGFRVLARLEDGDPDLWSRSGREYAERFPRVAADLGRGLRSPRIVVDGEICALDDAGRPSFQLLQNGGGTLAYYVFDLLELEGTSLRDLPLEERRGLLEELIDETSATVRFSRSFPDGEALLEFARAQGLEGVVAKRRGSPYLSGRRSPEWQKVKVRLTGTFAVVGWTRGEGSRERLGSLVLGARTAAGDLHWVGHVGSGLSEAEIDRLLARLRPLARGSSPLDRAERDPRLRRGRVTWVEPELQARVRFSEWTNDGRVRAPVYLGLAEEPEEIARVPSAPAAADTGAPLARDTAPGASERYGRRVGTWIVPYLRGRPPPVDDDAWAGLELPLAPPATPTEPDIVLFDLTPGRGAGFAGAARVALHIRDALAGLGLRAYSKTRGDDGLHVCVPAAPGLSSTEASAFARAVAEAVSRTFPIDAAAAPRRVPRTGVLIDWRGNTAGGVVSVPYVPATAGGAVSCPLSWDELDPPLDPRGLTPSVVADRLERLGDLFAPVLEGGQDLRLHLGGG